MSFENAREYLAKVIPWPQDGEAPVFVNIHWTFMPKDLEPGKKAPWTGRACRSLDEAVKAVDYALKRPNTRDIYVCLSTQKSATEKKFPRTGGTYYTPIRLQSNAVALKSLFIDIDFKGGDHGYDTPDEAVTALGNFIKTIGLPKPSCVVSSGGGMHVYWTLARALTPPEWLPLAYALAEATKRHGLKCDTQCTIDSARVLRVPDTFNRKSEPPRPVSLAKARTDFDYEVDRIAVCLEPYKTTLPATSGSVMLDPSLFPSRPPLTDSDALSAGIDTGKAAPADLDALKGDCGFLREAIDTGGAAFTNPLWNLTTLIATFSKGGRADAHRMGNKHAGYTQESTDELFDRKEREKDEKGLGWPSCRTISGSGCKHCQSCPHFALGKSPLHLQRSNVLGSAGGAGGNPHRNGLSLGAGFGGTVGQAQPAVSQSDLPAGYSRRMDGVILRQLTLEDGTTSYLPICSYPMFDPWLQKNPWILHFTSIVETGKAKDVAVPFADSSAVDSMRSVLWAQGVAIRKPESQIVMEFVVSWIEKLQKSKGKVISSAPFGWNVSNGALEGFCFGGHVWTAGGARQAAAPDPITAAQYEPTGERKPWIEAAEMVTRQKRPSLDAIIAASFGAPLVRFTGQTGLLMSCYSIESGIGKSTALKIAQSVWGDPIKAVQGLSDTQNAVLNKIGEIRALPLYWDELKTEDDTKRFVNLAFQLSLGKEKSRMTSSAQQRNPGTWQTILVSASNESLLDFVVSKTKMTTAGLYRVFEYEVTPSTGVGQASLGDAQRLLAALHDNYGMIGLEYAKFLGANFSRINQEITKEFKRLENDLKIKPDERYWVALMTCVVMGAKYANELGFTNFDVKLLESFMVTTLGNMRNHRAAQPVDMKNSMNVSNILAQFLNENRARHTLYTNKISRGVGKPKSDEIKILRDMSRLESAYIRIGVDDRTMRISSSQLSSWLQDAGYSRHLFMRALETEFGAKTIQGFIGSGTQFATAREYLIEIDLTNPATTGFIDEV